MATDELPANYNKLDLVLHCVFDMEREPAKAAPKAGVDRSVVEAVLAKYEASAHKRNLPPMIRPRYRRVFDDRSSAEAERRSNMNEEAKADFTANCDHVHD